MKSIFLCSTTEPTQIVPQLFFKGKRNGVFVEIGALNGFTFSNTLQLNCCLGWTGLLIEGSTNNYKGLVANMHMRPGATAIHAAVCSPPQRTVEFAEGRSGKVSGVVAEAARGFKAKWWGQVPNVRKEPCEPMAALFRNLKHIDFWSLDVEVRLSSIGLAVVSSSWACKAALVPRVCIEHCSQTYTMCSI